ncbi:MAG: hypothetical protein ACLSCR_12285 [Akkermansia sp.]|uniref:hypothetical protein n=1 Tax=Akkermansia sp. TaxID=1872421 RepID=UPI003A221C86
MSAGSTILVLTGTYTDAIENPPVTEDEAVEAVDEMNGYQARGRVGRWHTMQASLAHEKHHLRELNDAFKFYWDNLRIQDSIELQHVSCEKFPKMDDALNEMRKFVRSWTATYMTAVKKYVELLPDKENTVPTAPDKKF